MAGKAAERIKYYKNPAGPVIASVSRKVIEQDGLYFKDLDGSGQMKPFDDWRLPAKTRAEAYVKELTIEEKIAQLFISDWRMGKYPIPGSSMETQELILDESGTLDEGEFTGKTIFGEQHLPGTSTLLKEWFSRHLILRANATAEDMTDWMNQLHAVAEECQHFIPVSVASNSRNENGEVVFGMNDAAGVFATWPGTLGIAAAVKGAGIEIVDRFASCVKREWNACGLRKGYMYMADIMTDPRWQRSYGTFGEDPELVCEIMEHLIPGIQGSKEGVTQDGVAMTTKHFPGGGARENGFDPHYAAGQWNVYATEDSLQKYHIPAFQVAVKNHTSSIMPYYSKPSAKKSKEQKDCLGNTMEFEPYGFAYNRPFIQNMLRDQIGFEGYINSDTGIAHNMCWGVEMLDIPERIGFAVNHAGVDIISGLFDNEAGMEAYQRGKNDYYDTHPVPEGFTKEQLVLTDEALDRAVTRTLTELFQLGMFENPYRDAKKAKEVTTAREDWEEAEKVHRQSVVLLKNDSTLPLTKEKLAGKKVYAEAFQKDAAKAEQATKALRDMLGSVTLTENPEEADFAILMVSPSSGEYFNATPGYLELDICEEKEVCNVDEEGRPEKETHKETTLAGLGRFREIAQKVHQRGGKVIANINFTLAWEVGNIETLADALLAGFDTYPRATLDVIFGTFSPVGRLPITLPKDDSVLAVNKQGVCVSPNDVPGYDKDVYMPECMKDENGKAYAYRDRAGNYYELNFGLSYKE
ncbi:MAG: glycoside hydrolase family 3 N-terminal domain-containing protein [Blautia sp.]|uniref:glycoside hydrolase family 3 N-terminal domain-containing protein n=1 Tax=Blautia sp. TaxID=1955243 RepID=UPI002E78EBA3|nr:glycoside hydrolase family 3 N-terminal domain-containing protein [Blautia sp.]MEE1442274.1 glycoside hydrolase family 3 N-terminal domain-containing protein [Blautia sp.]